MLCAAGNDADDDVKAPVVDDVVAMATSLARRGRADGVPAQRGALQGQRRRDDGFPDEMLGLRRSGTTSTGLSRHPHHFKPHHPPGYNRRYAAAPHPGRTTDTSAGTCTTRNPIH